MTGRIACIQQLAFNIQHHCRQVSDERELNENDTHLLSETRGYPGGVIEGSRWPRRRRCHRNSRAFKAPRQGCVNVQTARVDGPSVLSERRPLFLTDGHFTHPSGVLLCFATTVTGGSTSGYPHSPLQGDDLFLDSG
jgi:hypothetical protein